MDPSPCASRGNVVLLLIFGDSFSLFCCTSVKKNLLRTVSRCRIVCCTRVRTEFHPYLWGRYDSRNTKALWDSHDSEEPSCNRGRKKSDGYGIPVRSHISLNFVPGAYSRPRR